MTTTDLARHTNGSLARPDDVGGYQPMRPLDVYSRGLADETPRVDALATISCGRLVGDGENARPAAAKKSDKQWIYIHDPNERAPGLTVALQRGQGRRLTIAFPFDDPHQFVMMRFAEYSKSALKAYGDERQVTEIIPQGDSAQHRTHLSGSEEYDRIVGRCKTSVSVYFALAEWADDGPRVVFPDGLGMYRLRFTSRNTLRNLLATLDQTAKMTNNRIAGIPFDLGVDFREVAAPNGKKRSIPVFTFVMAPPGGITSRTFRTVTGTALSQGEALRMLPSPNRETWETATLDGPVGDDVTAEDIAILERGGLCDKRHYTKLWHAMVRDTSLASKEGRAAFLDEVSEQRFDSLSLFLDQASESDAALLIECARDYLVERGELAVSDEEEEEPEKPRATAADYVKEYGHSYGEEPQVIEAEARAVDSPADAMEALAVDAETHERLQNLKSELDEVINDGTAETADSAAAETEPPAYDYGMCMEAWDNADKRLGIPKPLPRGNAEYYQMWWEQKYLPAVSKDLPY